MRPEFLVQKFGVGLHGQSGVGHHVLLRSQNFAQPFDFGVHAIEELLDRVNPQLATLITIQRETNRYVLGQLEQHGLIGLLIGSLRGKSGERLLQRVLRADGQGAQPRLKGGHFHARFRILARLA